jgi:hypothetical protein
MKNITKKIVEIGNTLPDEKRNDILALAMFYRWQKFGGTKTAEVCRGEDIHNSIKCHKQLTAYLCLNQPVTLAG